ncbi:Hypothetical predicted protein [Lecanosticta acicola]|uniref:Uncharacterized protein n=1 Tax=Lecanosticta acicola TaxID=111012 RepID=A0AAI8Z9H1_9PEZI|nr:Hypothetical predicted protein [Lecanosticta acicola]
MTRISGPRRARSGDPGRRERWHSFVPKEQQAPEADPSDPSTHDQETGIPVRRAIPAFIPPFGSQYAESHEDLEQHSHAAAAGGRNAADVEPQSDDRWSTTTTMEGDLSSVPHYSALLLRALMRPPPPPPSLSRTAYPEGCSDSEDLAHLAYLEGYAPSYAPSTTGAFEAIILKYEAHPDQKLTRQGRNELFEPLFERMEEHPLLRRMRDSTFFPNLVTDMSMWLAEKQAEDAAGAAEREQLGRRRKTRRTARRSLPL